MIYLGIGSSIGVAQEIFESAQIFLEKKKIKVLKKSKILKNPPLTNEAQNEFSNAVWEIACDWSPTELLEVLKEAEILAGRDLEAKRWSDRVLDLDILTMGDLILKTEKLTIPHSEIPNRIFVLVPWAELVSTDFEIPLHGNLQKCLKKIQKV